MRVLALDTTTRAGSVALVEDSTIVEERVGDARRAHAERLPADILDLAAAHRIEIADVDLFAVAAGPGSFTGLRIGIATIQGLAFVTGRPVAAVSALEALAYAGRTGVPPHARIGVWMDAHRHDVFSALYEMHEIHESLETPEPSEASKISDAPRAISTPHGAVDSIVEREPPSVGPPAAVLTRWERDHRFPIAAFVGDGAVLYEHEIRAVMGPQIRVVDIPSLAGAIGCLAIARAQSGQLTAPGDVRPLYVRRPDAEVARDRARMPQAADRQA